MPEIKKLDDGTVEVTYETGEKFKGDPMEVMNEIGKAHESTKRWSQNIKAENENLKAQHLNPPAPAPAAPVGNADELALQSYLLDQQAKAMGYPNGQAWLEDWKQGKQVIERQSNEQVAADFMLACPEFTGEKDAVEKLAAKIDEMGWQYDPRSLMAAHLMCMREGAYRVLTNDEINMAANSRAASQEPTRPVPPTPPQGGAPGNADQTNPWAMSTDELRKKVLEGGGLGKALLEMPTGGSLG